MSEKVPSGVERQRFTIEEIGQIFEIPDHLLPALKAPGPFEIAYQRERLAASFLASELVRKLTPPVPDEGRE